MRFTGGMESQTVQWALYVGLIMVLQSYFVYGHNEDTDSGQGQCKKNSQNVNFDVCFVLLFFFVCMRCLPH